MKSILIFVSTSLIAFNLQAQSGIGKEAAGVNTETQKIISFFQNLDKNHMNLVEQFYDREVEFQDPVHTLHGSKATREYYAKLYDKVESIRFEFSREISQEHQHVVVWKMFLIAPSLNGGREFFVEGNSVILFGGSEGKVIYHRDYFDMGSFIYERIPLLKTIILMLKSKLAGN